MKISFYACSAWLALLALAPLSATAETRMQVAVGSSPVYTQPSASAQKAGNVSSGDILFVARVEGDWAAISPPDNFDLWLNKDFIEGNRIIAKSIQVRSGPGVQYDAVGTLERGAPVMPRGEEGDWCKIAPPSSATLWVQQKDLSEVRTHTSPIEEVTAVAEPPKPVPTPEPAGPAPQPTPEPTPNIIAPAPQPEPQPQPAPQVVAQPATAPATPVKISPSNPNAPAPQPASRPVVSMPAPVPQPVAAPSVVPAPAPTAQPSPAPQANPVVAKPQFAAQPKPVATPAAPALRPATAIPGPAPHPASTNVAAPRPAPQPVRRPPAMPAVSKSIPAPASTVKAQKSKDVEVKVDQALVDDLDLADLPNQGKAVQVEGELRNAPFMAASPSRYRLVDEDDDGLLQMICHIHGDPEELRQYVGKGVSIRGREYWVEDSDMPVVVVGQIVPLAPTTDNEEDAPVMF